MRVKIDSYLRYSFTCVSDVLLAMEAIPMGDQQLLNDKLTVSVGPTLHSVDGVDGLGRLLG